MGGEPVIDGATEMVPSLFPHEAALREMLKRTLGRHRLFWVEPASGSTPGMPDVMVPVGGGRIVMIELKVGTVIAGQWRCNLRPMQSLTIGSLVDQGAWVVVLVGERGGSGLWAVSGARARRRRGQMLPMVRITSWGDIVALAQCPACWGE
jgi:hypothetical protein